MSQAPWAASATYWLSKPYTDDALTTTARAIAASSTVRPASQPTAASISIVAASRNTVSSVVDQLAVEVDQGQMLYFDRTEIPFYYSLANAFTVCDRWFSSAPCQTYPNRRFLLAGTANGLMDDLLTKRVQAAGITAVVHLTVRSGNRVGALIGNGADVQRIPALPGLAHARHLVRRIATALSRPGVDGILGDDIRLAFLRKFKLLFALTVLLGLGYFALMALWGWAWAHVHHLVATVAVDVNGFHMRGVTRPNS